MAWADDQNHLYGPVEAVNYNSPDFPDFRGGATTTQPLNQAQHWMVGAGQGGAGQGRVGSWLASAGGAACCAAGWIEDQARLAPVAAAQVWMRPGGSVAVTKLYAQINQKIPAGGCRLGCWADRAGSDCPACTPLGTLCNRCHAGPAPAAPFKSNSQPFHSQKNIAVTRRAGSTVRVAVSNRYNMYAFGGSKSVILTTNSWMGGRNNFLGAAYITVGGLCLLAALAFFLAYNAGGCAAAGRRAGC